MSERVLVTGIGGLLASSLVERAEAVRDVEVTCVDRPDFDLGQPDTITRTVRDHDPDVVIGAAAYTAVDQAEDEPDLAMRLNGEAAGWLARAARNRRREISAVVMVWSRPTRAGGGVPAPGAYGLATGSYSSSNMPLL